MLVQLARQGLRVAGEAPIAPNAAITGFATKRGGEPSRFTTPLCFRRGPEAGATSAFQIPDGG
jgi:hypothetical protein